MYIIIYDFGTSSVKTCLFQIDSQIHLVAGASAEYGLYVSDNGGAEQDVEEWWNAICSTTRNVLKKSDVKPNEIEGMAFCSQMQGAVFVDENGNALRRPMNYLDQKGFKEYKECMGSGIIKVSGCSLYKLVRNLLVNYAGSTRSGLKTTNRKLSKRSINGWISVTTSFLAAPAGSSGLPIPPLRPSFMIHVRGRKDGIKVF